MAGLDSEEVSSQDLMDSELGVSRPRDAVSSPAAATPPTEGGASPWSFGRALFGRVKTFTTASLGALGGTLAGPASAAPAPPATPPQSVSAPRTPQFVISDDTADQSARTVASPSQHSDRAGTPPLPPPRKQPQPPQAHGEAVPSPLAGPPPITPPPQTPESPAVSERDHAAASLAAAALQRAAAAAAASWSAVAGASRGLHIGSLFDAPSPSAPVRTPPHPASSPVALARVPPVSPLAAETPGEVPPAGLQRILGTVRDKSTGLAGVLHEWWRNDNKDVPNNPLLRTARQHPAEHGSDESGSDRGAFETGYRFVFGSLTATDQIRCSWATSRASSRSQRWLAARSRLCRLPRCRHLNPPRCPCRCRRRHRAR
jgi:hypothetical protein